MERPPGYLSYAKRSKSLASSNLLFILYKSLMVQSIITLFTLVQSMVSAMEAASTYSPFAIKSFISCNLTLYSYLSTADALPRLNLQIS